jgi:cytidylate kinase
MSERVVAGPAQAGASPGRRPGLVAVDGSAASGKSTIGRRLAERLAYRFLDTGIMYRAVTRAALLRGIDVHDAGALTALASALDMRIVLAPPGSSGDARAIVDGEDVTPYLRTPDVDDNVSFVSRVAGVREALVQRQREIAREGPIVMAGRDIGSVVLPDAQLKLFLDASPQERARRRHAEFLRSGHQATETDVFQDLRRRDQLDSEREVSPQRPAEDAVYINTDGMTSDEVLERVIELVSR